MLWYQRNEISEIYSFPLFVDDGGAGEQPTAFKRNTILNLLGRNMRFL